MTTKPGLKFSVATIDSAKEILKALPPAPREMKEVSLREAIEELAPTIRGLLGKGYSRQQIVDLIQEQGVGCSLSALKTYFRPAPGKPKAKSSAGTTATSTAASRETGQAAPQGWWSAAALAGPKCELPQRLPARQRRTLSRRRAVQPEATPEQDCRPTARQAERQRRRRNPSTEVQGAAAGRDRSRRFCVSAAAEGGDRPLDMRAVGKEAGSGAGRRVRRTAGRWRYGS